MAKRVNCTSYDSYKFQIGKKKFIENAGNTISGIQTFITFLRQYKLPSICKSRDRGALWLAAFSPPIILISVINFSCVTETVIGVNLCWPSRSYRECWRWGCPTLYMNFSYSENLNISSDIYSIETSRGKQIVTKHCMYKYPQTMKNNEKPNQNIEFSQKYESSL